MHVSDPCEQRFVFKWIKWKYTAFHTESYSTSRIVRISLITYRGKHIRKIGLQFIYIDNERVIGCLPIVFLNQTPKLAIPLRGNQIPNILS